ncbi:MAG TPA: tetratricopeptide repeat protein [Candidatus Kryptonia bacterium]
MEQEAVLYFVEIVSGFALGAFINMQVVLPLFYKFPKALVLWARKKLLYRAVLVNLVPPVIWIVIFFLVYLFFPVIFLTDFVDSMEFAGGVAGGVAIFSGYSVLTKRGRLHLKYDFFNRTRRHIATAGIMEYLVLANESLKFKQYERAIKIFRQADAIEPGNPTVHLGLGLCYIGVLSFKEALKEYEYLSNRSPNAATKLYGALMKVGKAPLG